MAGAAEDECRVPKYSDELEAALQEVFPSDDPLDSPDFDPVAYINEVFPDERSLGRRRRGGAPEPEAAGDEAEEEAESLQQQVTLESFQRSIHRRAVVIQEEITRNVKQHSCQRLQTKQAVEDSKEAIGDLFLKIKAIKEKAERSEVMVQEICRDIKQLDYAKKHLTETITSLRRLQMLVSAADQLELMAKKRQYRDAARLLEAVEALMTHFAEYDDVPELRRLAKSVAETKETLRRAIFHDFREYTPAASASAAAGQDPHVQQLNSGCQVLDVLGESIKGELLEWFCQRQMEEYRQLFAPGREGGTLEAVERRYSWLVRCLRSYTEGFADIFPAHWLVPARLCVEFCRLSRQHLAKILGAHDADEGSGGGSGGGAADDGEFAGASAGTQLLIKMLQKTKDFEREMTLRFRPGRHPVSDYYVDDDGREVLRPEAVERERQMAASGVQRDFTGLVSEVFMPHLGGYVDLERRNMQQLCDKIAGEEQWTVEEGGARAGARLRGADEVLLYIKKSLTRAARLTTGQVLFDVSGEWVRGLGRYAALLESRLPSSPKELSRVELGSAALVINTAEYCMGRLPGLEEQIAKTVDEKHREQVDLGEALERFGALANQAGQCLVDALGVRLGRVLASMTRLPWAQWESVGDQSDYVTQIKAILLEDVPDVAHMLSGPYHDFFCVHLVNFFVPRFEESVQKCRRIGELGAQQLSLDAHALKSIMLEVPNIGNDDSGEHKKHRPSRRFLKYVNREMGKVEAMLKVLTSPPQRLIATFKTLMAGVPKEQAPEQLTRIMELKGLKRSEQQGLVDSFNAFAAPDERVSLADSSITRKFFNFSSKS